MQVNEVLPRVARAVRTHVPDAPTNMLLADTALAAASLFKLTKVLLRPITLSLQQGVPDYLLDECPGEGLVWHEIASAEVNGQRFRPVPSLTGVGSATCHSGTDGAQVSWDREAHTILVAPTPKLDFPDGLRLSMVVTTDGAVSTPLPATVMNDPDMQDALVAGAVARVLGDMMPRAAEDHRATYHRLTTAIVTRRLMGWGASPAQMTARGFMAR